MSNKIQINSLGQKYAENTLLRFLVNLVPSIGGSIDIALSERWNKLQAKRIESIIKNLELSLKDVEEHKLNKYFLNSDEFIDLIMICFRIGAKARYKEKIEILASVIKKSITEEDFDLNEFEEISWFIDNLTLKEFQVLLILEKWEFMDEDNPDRIEEIENIKYTSVWDTIVLEIMADTKISGYEEVDLVLDVLEQKGLFHYSPNFSAIRKKHHAIPVAGGTIIDRDYMKGRVSSLYFKIRNYIVANES